MIKHRDIVNQKTISSLGPGWEKTKLFNNKIGKNERGQFFNLIAKHQKPLSWNNPQKIGKLILGCFASVFSFCLAPLFSKKVRHLFIPRKIVYEGELLPPVALKPPSEKPPQNVLVKPIILEPRKPIEPVAGSTNLSSEVQVDHVAPDLQLEQINPIVPQPRKTLEPEAPSSSEDLPAVSQEDPIVKPVEYTRAFFETRFEKKNNALAKKDLDLFKEQATQLLDVLKKYKCNEEDQNIHIKALDSDSVPLSPSQLDAKKYDLALKTVRSFSETLENDLPAGKIKKGNSCKAPHVRLTGISQGMKRELVHPDQTKERVFLLVFKTLEPGTYNTVDRVYSLTHQKDFVLRSLIRIDDVAQAAFDREIKVHQRFMKNNPHIVPLIGVIETKNSTKIQKSCLLEACHTDLFRLRRSIIKSEYHQCAYDMIAGIAKIHEELGYIHGDLKDENILFQEIKGVQKLFLADFGSSRPFGRISYLKGTIELLPFEALSLTQPQPQAQQDEIALFSQSIDTWALGLLCYSLFKGSKDLKKITDGVLVLDKHLSDFFQRTRTYMEFVRSHPLIRDRYLGDLSWEGSLTELQIYQKIMEKHFKPLFEQEVAEIVKSLDDSPYSVMIKGFLNMNVKERWTAAKALQFMEDNNLVQKK